MTLNTFRDPRRVTIRKVKDALKASEIFWGKLLFCFTFTARLKRLMWHDMPKIASMNLTFFEFPRQINLFCSFHADELRHKRSQLIIIESWCLSRSLQCYLQIEIIKNVGPKTFGRHVEWFSRCNFLNSHKNTLIIVKKKLQVYGLMELKLIKLHLLRGEIVIICKKLHIERDWKTHSWELWKTARLFLPPSQSFITIKSRRFVSIALDNNADLFWKTVFIQTREKSFSSNKINEIIFCCQLCIGCAGEAAITL